MENKGACQCRGHAVVAPVKELTWGGFSWQKGVYFLVFGIFWVFFWSVTHFGVSGCWCIGSLMLFATTGLFIFHKIFLARIFTQGYSWEILPSLAKNPIHCKTFCWINIRHHKNFRKILRALWKSNGLNNAEAARPKHTRTQASTDSSNFQIPDIIEINPPKAFHFRQNFEHICAKGNFPDFEEWPYNARMKVDVPVKSCWLLFEKNLQQKRRGKSHLYISACCGSRTIGGERWTIFTSLPLKKARSSIAVPVVSRATRPLVSSPIDTTPSTSHQPSKDQSQQPHEMCHPPLMFHPCMVHGDGGSKVPLPLGAKSLVSFLLRTASGQTPRSAKNLGTDPAFITSLALK